jgi:putative tricarboxylic transport membrane protein
MRLTGLAGLIPGRAKVIDPSLRQGGPEMTKNPITKDTITGVLAVALGIAYLAGTFKIPVMEAADEVGPRSFPFIIAATVIICGLWLLLKEWANKERKAFSFGFITERGIWLRILLSMAAGIVYGLILDGLGYLIATVLFMFSVGELINIGRHKQNLVIALVFAVFTFVAFALILQLSMPRGILSFLPF